MGLEEEAGKVAGGVVRALEASPMVMAILIFNLMFMGLTTWQTMDARKQFRELIADVLHNCGPAKDKI